MSGTSLQNLTNDVASRHLRHNLVRPGRNEGRLRRIESLQFVKFHRLLSKTPETPILVRFEPLKSLVSLISNSSSLNSKLFAHKNT